MVGQLNQWKGCTEKTRWCQAASFKQVYPVSTKFRQECLKKWSTARCFWCTTAQISDYSNLRKFQHSEHLLSFHYNSLKNLYIINIWISYYFWSFFSKDLSGAYLFFTTQDNFRNSWRKIQTKKRTFPQKKIIWSWSCDYFSCEWQPCSQHLDTMRLFCMRWIWRCVIIWLCILIRKDFQGSLKHLCI